MVPHVSRGAVGEAGAEGADVLAGGQVLGVGFVTLPQHYMECRLAFLWDMDKTKWCNGLYIQFRQSFA